MILYAIIARARVADAALRQVLAEVVLVKAQLASSTAELKQNQEQLKVSLERKQHDFERRMNDSVSRQDEEINKLARDLRQLERRGEYVNPDSTYLLCSMKNDAIAKHNKYTHYTISYHAYDCVIPK